MYKIFLVTFCLFLPLNSFSQDGFRAANGNDLLKNLSIKSKIIVEKDIILPPGEVMCTTKGSSVFFPSQTGTADNYLLKHNYQLTVEENKKVICCIGLLNVSSYEKVLTKGTNLSFTYDYSKKYDSSGNLIMLYESNMNRGRHFDILEFKTDNGTDILISCRAPTGSQVTVGDFLNTFNQHLGNPSIYYEIAKKHSKNNTANVKSAKHKKPTAGRKVNSVQE